jgi:hypothetical protein
MTIHELANNFEFVFLEELEEKGFAFRLSVLSPYVYMSEKMRDQLSEDFDTTFDELVLMDYSSSELDEIELDVLKLLRKKEELYYGEPNNQQKTIADL